MEDAVVNNDSLQIRMFGRFEATYKGKKIFSDRGGNSKSVRLLQILLANIHRGGVPRHDLIEWLYKEDDVADTSNSLRVNSHRLKKILSSGGVPGTDYFLIEKGNYIWNENIPIQIDTVEFDNLIEEAEGSQDREKKKDLLYKAFELYRGDFLEEIGAEEWVVIYSVYYKQKYVCAVSELLALLHEEQDYLNMLDVSREACRIAPYEEWQVQWIESLQMLGKKKEAFNVYRDTLRMYREDLGIDLPQNMMDQVYKIDPSFRDNYAVIAQDIREKLEETLVEHGASYLNFQNFANTFRMMMRITQRNGQDMCIMLCELLVDPDMLRGEYDRIEAMTDALQDVIHKSLRRGDCFTNYGNNRFLILLTGTSDDKCDMIYQRIALNYKKVKRLRKAKLNYQMVPIDSLMDIL